MITSGVPDPETIDWYKGITKLSSTSTELQIPSVAKGDKGDYYCVARNNYGLWQIVYKTISLSFK